MYIIKVISCLALTIVVTALAARAAQQGAPQGPPSKESLPGASNYTRVDATVACGGATSPEALPELKRRGFAAVINFRMASEAGANVEAETAAAQAAGLKYIHLPFNSSAPDPAVPEAFLKAVIDPANHPVYIHCASANRVGAMWLIKRALVDGWPLDKATAEADAIGLTSERLRQFAHEYIRDHRNPKALPR